MPPFHMRYSSPCKIKVDFIISAISSPVSNSASSHGAPNATSSDFRSALCPCQQTAQPREVQMAGWQLAPSYTHLPLAPPTLPGATPCHRSRLTTGFQHSNKLQMVAERFPLLLAPPRCAAISVPIYILNLFPSSSPKSCCLTFLLPALPCISSHSLCSRPAFRHPSRGEAEPGLQDQPQAPQVHAWAQAHDPASNRRGSPTGRGGEDVAGQEMRYPPSPLPTFLPSCTTATSAPLHHSQASTS